MFTMHEESVTVAREESSAQEGQGQTDYPSPNSKWHSSTMYYYDYYLKHIQSLECFSGKVSQKKLPTSLNGACDEQPDGSTINQYSNSPLPKAHSLKDIKDILERKILESNGESEENKSNKKILENILRSLTVIDDFNKLYDLLCKSSGSGDQNRDEINKWEAAVDRILLPGNPLHEPEALYLSEGVCFFCVLVALASLSVPTLSIAAGAIAAVFFMLFIVNVFGIHFPYTTARSFYNLTEALKSEMTLVEKLHELSNEDFTSKINNASKLDTAECISLTQLALNLKSSTTKPYQAEMYKCAYKAGQFFNTKRLYESSEVSTQRNDLESLAFNSFQSSL